MGKYEYFSRLWPENQESLFDGDESLCDHAEDFSAWAEDLVAKVKTEPDQVAVNQAKVQLIDRYFDWRSTVPKSHRNRISETGHTCIFHVFEKTYQALRAIELSLKTTPLVIPETSPAKATIYQPLILGEE